MTTTTPSPKRIRRVPTPEFTITDEAYAQALESLRRRVENPIKPLPVPESVPNSDLATVDAYHQERAYHWKGSGLLRLFFPGCEGYLIDLNLIQTKGALLDQTLQLLRLPLTTDQVRAVVLKIVKIRGIHVSP